MWRGVPFSTVLFPFLRCCYFCGSFILCVCCRELCVRSGCVVIYPLVSFCVSDREFRPASFVSIFDFVSSPVVSLCARGGFPSRLSCIRFPYVVLSLAFVGFCVPWDVPSMLLCFHFRCVVTSPVVSFLCVWKKFRPDCFVSIFDFVSSPVVSFCACGEFPSPLFCVRFRYLVLSPAFSCFWVCGGVLSSLFGYHFRCVVTSPVVSLCVWENVRSGPFFCRF